MARSMGGTDKQEENKLATEIRDPQPRNLKEL